MLNNRLLLGVMAVSLVLSALASVGKVYAAPAQRSCTGADVSIGSPAGSTVSGSVPIYGSASLPGGQFRYYKVEFSAAGQNAWVVIADGVRTQVHGGVLATFNAAALAPGDYTLRVLAVDATGNYCEALGTVTVSSANATPTPGASDTPLATIVPSASGTPLAQSLAGKVTPTPAATAVPGTPTVVVDLQSNVPGQDSIFGSGKSSVPLVPTEFVGTMGTVGSSAGEFAGQISHQFVFGMQAMAGLFILLGVIVFLRQNL